MNATPASAIAPHRGSRPWNAQTDARDCMLFAALVAVSRFVFRSHFLYDIDSVNFALALGKFDPSVHQPHPPGYFLYVMLGRMVNTLFQDANSALVAISIAASCGAIVMIYLLSSIWFGRGAARFSATFFLFSPLVWFHGAVALTYGIECFFSALVGYLCWRLRTCGTSTVGLTIGLSLALGVAAGFRPSSLLFLGPLWAYSVFTTHPRRLLLSAATLLGMLLCWFVPMLLVVGGPQRYFQSLLALWSLVPAKNTVLSSPVAYCIARLVTILAIACLCFGSAAAFTFRKIGVSTQENRDRAIFAWVWIAPGLLFFTFVFLLFVNSGYLLVLSPPLFAYLGRNADAWSQNWKGTRPWKTAILVTAAVANTAFFVFSPLYCSYRSIRHFESELISLTSAVRRNVSPADTMLIGFDTHFLGYRHAAYYLPEYLTVQYPELTLGGRPGAFAAEHQQTEFLRILPKDRFDKFVLLPLLPDEEHQAYMKRVLSQFPPGKLREKNAGAWSFSEAPLSDLKYLFAHL